MLALPGDGVPPYIVSPDRGGNIVWGSARAIGGHSDFWAFQYVDNEAGQEPAHGNFQQREALLSEIDTGVEDIEPLQLESTSLSRPRRSKASIM